ncbi:MAG: hypothetical protein R2741_08240 [Methanolobus sp.]
MVQKKVLRVAASPLITDVLIVSFIILILLNLRDQDIIIAIISFSGAIYLAHLGIASLKTKKTDVEFISCEKDSLKKALQ